VFLKFEELYRDCVGIHAHTIRVSNTAMKLLNGVDTSTDTPIGDTWDYSGADTDNSMFRFWVRQLRKYLRRVRASLQRVHADAFMQVDRCS